MNNSNEPCATKAERFQKSSLSLMDFNVEEAIKNLEMCLHVGKENISQKKTENCTVLTISLGKMLLIDQLMEDIENILNLSILEVGRWQMPGVYYLLKALCRRYDHRASLFPSLWRDGELRGQCI